MYGATGDALLQKTLLNYPEKREVRFNKIQANNH